MTRAGERIRRLLRTAWEHPESLQPVKAAAAVAIAWAVVLPIPGIGDRYPYYAPLGALIAVSGTVPGSARGAGKAMVAILLGAPIAWGFDLVFPTNVATLAAVVALATLVSRWSWLGGQASWAPVSALFVMVVGRGQPSSYVAAYVGFTTLGALIGLGVDLALPSLPLNATQAVVTRLRATLAEQLDHLAEGLMRERPPSSEEWAEQRFDIASLTREARSMVDHTAEARRANWRARRWRSDADRQYAQARALERLASLVEDMTTVVTDQERAEREQVAMGPAVRPSAATALRAMAEALRSVRGPTADPELLRRTDEALQRLVDEIRATRERTGDDMFGAGELVMTLRTALTALAPQDLATVIPSPHPPAKSDVTRRVR